MHDQEGALGLSSSSSSSSSSSFSSYGSEAIICLFFFSTLQATGQRGPVNQGAVLW